MRQFEVKEDGMDEGVEGLVEGRKRKNETESGQRGMDGGEEGRGCRGKRKKKRQSQVKEVMGWMREGRG